MGSLVRIVKDRLGNLYSAHDANVGAIPVSTEESDFVYDSETKVVYWCSYVPKYTYLSPYISENGKFCRFIDNQIVEIG